MRLLRARFALLLRTLLRAERGDYGKWGPVCRECGSREVMHDYRGWGCEVCGAWDLDPAFSYRRVRPLWEIAR